MIGRLRFLGRALFGAGGLFGVMGLQDKNKPTSKPGETRDKSTAEPYLTPMDLRMPVDLVLHPRWIIPMDQGKGGAAKRRPQAVKTLHQGAAAGEATEGSAVVSFQEPHYLEGHSIAILEGKIVGILPREAAAATWSPLEERALPESVLIPGLINAHTHSSMSLFRSWVDGIGVSEWLQEYIWPAESRFVTPGFVEFGSRLAIVEMLASGVTTFNDMYFFPEVTARVCQAMGIRAVIGLPVLEFPTNYAGSAQEYLRKGVATLEGFPRHPLVTFAWAPHAPYTVSDDTWRKVQQLAEYYDTKIHTHVHESALNVADSLGSRGVRPLERLRCLGLLSERLIAVHMTQVEPTDIALLLENRVNLVHCPESNLKLASGLCPAGTLLRAGVPVALGTDGAASNDDLDMLGELRTASLVDHYLSGQSSPSLSRYALLEMATIGGARVLGIDHLVGSLQPGKDADMVAIRINAHPVFDPLTTLTNSSVNSVTDVWVAGRHLVTQGRVIGVDYADLYAQADQWGSTLESSRH